MQTFLCPTSLLIIPKLSFLFFFAFFFLFWPVLRDYLSRTPPSLVSYIQLLIFTSILIARQWGLGSLFPFLLTRETKSKTEYRDKWWKTRGRNKRWCQKVCTHEKCWQQSQSPPPSLALGAKEDHLWLTEKQSWASSAPTHAYLGSLSLPPLIHSELKYKTSLCKEFMEQAQVFILQLCRGQNCDEDFRLPPASWKQQRLMHEHAAYNTAT